MEYYPQIKRVVEGRPFSEKLNRNTYENVLSIAPQVLDGRTVHDFGYGNSNIVKDLLEFNVYANVYGTDLVKGKKFSGIHLYPIDFFNIQTDIFDFTLASFSTYLIDLQDKALYYDHILRTTSTAIHLAPMYGNDWDVLTNLLQNQNKFRICSLKLLTLMDFTEKPIIQKTKDYLTTFRETQLFLDSHKIPHMLSRINRAPKFIPLTEELHTLDSSNTYQLILINPTSPILLEADLHP